MPEKGGGEGGLSAFRPSTYLGGILAMGIVGSGCEDGMGWRGWMDGDNTAQCCAVQRSLRLRPIASCS